MLTSSHLNIEHDHIPGKGTGKEKQCNWALFTQTIETVSQVQLPCTEGFPLSQTMDSSCRLCTRIL